MLLYAGCLACFAGFSLRAAVTDLAADPRAAPEEKVAPDGRHWGYTPGEVRRYFDVIGPHGRGLYASTQLSLDILFPLLYGALLCDLAVRLGTTRVGRRLLWVPVAAAVADLGENVLLASLACGATDRVELLVPPASCLTVLKCACLAATALGLVAAGLWRCYRVARVCRRRRRA